MSNPGTDDCAYLHESEWRIVHNDYLTETNRANWMGLENTPIAFLPFTKVDIKLIIVPDDEVRRMLYESKKFQAWLSRDREKPVVLSYEKLFEY